MNIHQPDTDLFDALAIAEAAFRTDDTLSLDILHAYEAAERAYNTALAQARAEWEAIPRSDARYDAETNADDSYVGENLLGWTNIALRTYRIGIDSGDYDADGNAR